MAVDRLGLFESKFIPEPNTGCWLWLGAFANGYAMFSVNRKAVYAHRWIWEAERGPIPGGLEIDHKCHMPSCVNPNHLEPVSHEINAQRAADFRALLSGRRPPLPIEEWRAHMRGLDQERGL